MTSKRSSCLLIAAIMWWSAWLGTHASGQDSPPGPCGFIRLLDAVAPGSGMLEFLIDGQAIRPQGYQLGNVTGGIALEPRVYQVRLRRAGVEDGQTQLTVVANETVIVIPFAQRVPATEDQPVHWQMRILRLKQHAADGQRTVSFVSVASDPELTVQIRQVTGHWESIQVKRLGVTRTAIRQARGYLPVRCHDQEFAPVSVVASGNLVAVIYEDASGKLGSINFQDYKYSGSQ